MSYDMVYEEVPRIKRRQGDNLIAGSNNATILLGRDRLDTIDSGYGSRTSPGSGKNTGAIHAIVGRKTEDPSIADDAATFYMSTKSDPDAAANTESISDTQISKSAAVLRADCIRIVPRVDFKISVGRAYICIKDDGSIVLEGDISLGAGASQRMMRGDIFSAFWSTVIIPTPGGPFPLPPIPDSAFSQSTLVK